MDNIIKQIRQTIFEYINNENHPKQNDLNYYPNGTESSIVQGDPKKIINQVPDTAILNFLDLINDKWVTSGKTALLPIEIKCTKFIVAMSNEYDKVGEEIISTAVDLEKINTVDEIVKELKTVDNVKFRVTQHGFMMTIYLALKRNLIMMESTKGIHTMYKVCKESDRFNRPAGRVDFIKRVWNKYGKYWNFMNLKVETALKSISNR